jgi:2-dehydro-3-deoxygluconokinase
MKVAELVTLLIGNETDLQTGLFGDASLVEKELVERLTELSVEGNLAWVAASQRESEQADQNRFGGLIYDFQHRMDKPQKYEVKKRTITRIVDRVGTGDAFCGAILDGFIRNIEPTYTLERAVMLGTLMHGIAGDACVIDNDLLERCLSDDSGRILR